MRIKHLILTSVFLPVFLIANLMFVKTISAQVKVTEQRSKQHDLPVSFGPAPIVENKNHPSGVLETALGTRMFTQISSSPTFQFGKSFLESCTITNIGSPFEMTFPGGLVFMEGTVYTWNQTEPFQLWSIDTVTGVHTFVFYITGIPLPGLTGMTWDGTNMYGVSASNAESQLLKINMATGVCTPIGIPTTICKEAISLSGRIGVSNGLFSVDIISDSFFRWDKTTGAPTLIGPLGAGNVEFGQDAQFDNSDGKLYWMSYILPTGASLRTIDTATGQSVLLCTYSNQATGIAPFYPSPRNYNEVIRAPISIPLDDFSLIKDSVLFPFQGTGSVVLHVNYRIINLTHTWDSDVRMYAQHLNTGSLIVNWVGGSGDNFINTVLNDSGAIPIASGFAPFDGTFRPSNPLTGFNGLSPDGYWKLVLTDSASGDTGLLTGWSIQVTYQNPVGGIHTIEIPNYYSLGQNYPNPFNPSTVIKFTLPKTENVKLVVFDILGKEVKTLVNEERTPGVYEINFDASSLSSGVYFYRLVAGSYTAAKKMLIIK